MELEDAINSLGQKYPFFPVALSVVEEKAKEEAELESVKRPKDELPRDELERKRIEGASVENVEKAEDNNSLSQANYSFNELILAQNTYGSKAVSVINNYDEAKDRKLSSGFDEENYMNPAAAEDIKTALLEISEAKEIKEKMEYAALFGTSTTAATNTDLRDMNLWIMTHPSEWLLIERDSLTREVNYRGY
ncbi:hypothetical protein J4479_01760 [Candidatus Woesearchaeota archaeon]|nr:hypothetical protein [Candidatus Woesearchaeota archaeon]